MNVAYHYFKLVENPVFYRHSPQQGKISSIYQPSEVSSVVESSLRVKEVMQTSKLAQANFNAKTAFLTFGKGTHSLGAHHGLLLIFTSRFFAPLQRDRSRTNSFGKRSSFAVGKKKWIKHTPFSPSPTSWTPSIDPTNKDELKAPSVQETRRDQIKHQ